MQTDKSIMPTTVVPGKPLDYRAMFDADSYLDINTDVRDSDADPFEHYRNFGYAEGRVPAPWFAPMWYKGLYLRNDLEDHGQKVDPFLHFCTIGNLLGLSPNPVAEQLAVAKAHELFDAEFYLQTNDDVAQSGADPWEHFVQDGWLEGRNPAPWFDLVWYFGEYIGPEVARHAPQPAVTSNGFLHYALLGKERGYRTQPPVPVAAPVGPDFTPAPVLEVKSLSLEAYLLRQAGPAEANLTDLLMSEDLDAKVALLNRSHMFNSDHYRKTSGLSGPRVDLIRHYLTEGAGKGLDPSPEFGGAFYASRYKTMPKATTDLAYSTDQAPLLHYLAVGVAKGFYPNAQIASLEIEVIRASGTFASEHYFKALKRRPILGDPIADYAFYGHLEGAEPRQGFDGKFVRSVYTNLAGEPVHAPLAHYLRNADRCWVFANTAEMRHEAALIRECPLFDADYYSEVAGIDPAEVDPAEHFAVVGVRNGFATSNGFDTEYYLTRYHDIGVARVNPLLHFYNFGRAEGRVAMPDVGTIADVARANHDPDRKTVLVFTHEASRTGAPIVALNVARKLAEDHNVIVWIGQADGPLTKEFGAAAVQVISGWGNVSTMTKMLIDLRERVGCRLAYVNSVVCNTAIAPLNRAGIASVSLIHEFATYVYPAGTLSRMALFSDVVVFPARMVQEACEQEMARMGISHLPKFMKIRPQGHNAAHAGKANLTREQISHQLNLEAGHPRQRVLFGAGQVQPRKGLDLFLQAAQQLLARGEYDWRFVWVGSGYDPAGDMNHSVYLAHQIKESGLSKHFSLFDEQISLEPFWEIADIFFLSSRLDPFPNVALDAFERHIPVICFEGGTGIGELEAEFPFAVRSVGFANPMAAADAITSLAGTQDLTAQAFAGAQGQALTRALSFDSYVADLKRFGHEAEQHREAVSQLAEDLKLYARSDISRAVRLVPATLRLNFFADETTDRHTLSTHLLDQSLALPVRLETDAKVVERLVPDTGVCGAAFGRAPGQLPPPEHLIHLHFNDAQLADLLFDPKSWTNRPLALSTLIITVSDRKVALALRSKIPNRAHLVEEPFADSFESLMHVADRPLADLVDGAVNSASLSAQTLTHCAVTPLSRPGERRLVARTTLDCLAALTSSATFDCLAQQSDVAAVVPLQLREDATAAVRSAFGQPLPKVHPPAFIGTFRREDLGRIKDQWYTRYLNGSMGLTVAERTALAALMFSMDVEERGRRILPTLELL